MPGVQGDDAGDGGGRVCWVEAAGGGGRREGERLQTGVRQQTAAAVALKHPNPNPNPSTFKARFALICDIKTLFYHRNTVGFLPDLNCVMLGKKIWVSVHTECQRPCRDEKQLQTLTEALLNTNVHHSRHFSRVPLNCHISAPHLSSFSCSCPESRRFKSNAGCRSFIQ